MLNKVYIIYVTESDCVCWKQGCITKCWCANLNVQPKDTHQPNAKNVILFSERTVKNFRQIRKLVIRTHLWTRIPRFPHRGWCTTSFQTWRAFWWDFSLQTRSICSCVETVASQLFDSLQWSLFAGADWSKSWYYGDVILRVGGLASSAWRGIDRGSRRGIDTFPTTSSATEPIAERKVDMRKDPASFGVRKWRSSDGYSTGQENKWGELFAKQRWKTPAGLIRVCNRNCGQMQLSRSFFVEGGISLGGIQLYMSEMFVTSFLFMTTVLFGVCHNL